MSEQYLEKIRKEVQTIKQRVRIEDYARQIGFTLLRKGKYLTCKEHDSLRIDTDKQKFWRNAYDVSGDIIDFVMHFEDVDKKDAIAKLKNIAHITNDISVPAKPPERTVPDTEPPKTFTLPEKDVNNKNVFAYLTQTRKIDCQIVNELMKDERLYQDKRKNCVFVGYDNERKPVFANQRGTNSQHKFVGDIVGSNYNECFYLNHGENKRLFIAESVIDILSVATLLKNAGIDYHDYNYLALSGTHKTQAISHHLQQQPAKSVILCLDNDAAGAAATERIKQLLSEHGCQDNIEVWKPEHKDWNEDLQQEMATRKEDALDMQAETVRPRQKRSR